MQDRLIKLERKVRKACDDYYSKIDRARFQGEYHLVTDYNYSTNEVIFTFQTRNEERTQELGRVVIRQGKISKIEDIEDENFGDYVLKKLLKWEE